MQVCFIVCLDNRLQQQSDKLTRSYIGLPYTPHHGSLDMLSFQTVVHAYTPMGRFFKTQRFVWSYALQTRCPNFSSYNSMPHKQRH